VTVAVAVLSGGLSLEREVSLRSGRRVAEALIDHGHRVTCLDLDDGLVGTLAEGAFDAAFIALHGKAGEDGTIQGLLDLLGIPYTGPGPTASALAWDKVVCKGLWARAGLDTPAWVALSSDAVRDIGAARALDRVVDRLGLPLIVKPAQGGAAMGVRRIARAEDVPPALVASYSYHDVVCIERFVEGTEVAVSIVDGEALPAVEIVPKEGVYDFSARYTHGATEFFAPARLPGDVLERCTEVALAAYQSVGCRRVTRADLMVDPTGRPWLLELDTCPGMTETSLLPLAAAAAGWDFAALCEHLVRSALEGRAS
jgi:D-alanine-D-alanine ligase